MEKEWCSVVAFQAHLSPNGDTGDEHEERKEDFGNDGFNQLGDIIASNIGQLTVVADLFRGGIQRRDRRQLGVPDPGDEADEARAATTTTQVSLVKAA